MEWYEQQSELSYSTTAAQENQRPCSEKAIVKIDPKISAPKIAASTSNTLGRSVSAETVRRVLRKAGYNGRVARKKPLIGKRNRVKRLKFTKEHILKPQQFWNEVIFSDESKFNIFGSDGRRMELWVQQDGATCHTARATIDLLKDTFGDRLISRFGPVNWPPRSCDLTPLDYFLWGYVKSLVCADKPQTLDHLEDNIRRVIADIRPQVLEKVIENWTSRLDYIRASRGSHMPEIIFKIIVSAKKTTFRLRNVPRQIVSDAICRFEELGNDGRRPGSGRKHTVNTSRNSKA
ncbi:transposable element Tc3 transposase [Trichonephila clavipes]|nr:transposable element Tc3 transposase [Trichonephila clavipes]